MTDEQVNEEIELIKRVTKELLKDKKKARKFLRDAGIPVSDEPFGIPKKRKANA